MNNKHECSRAVTYYVLTYLLTRNTAANAPQSDAHPLVNAFIIGLLYVRVTKSRDTRIITLTDLQVQGHLRSSAIGPFIR